ncbi:MAG TPA: GNAT family N-acetyltransferase [Kofleriaceae bacterium]|nr:GNAT family N-acetyltransferase [Kofleriaceae bacterium]
MPPSTQTAEPTARRTRPVTRYATATDAAALLSLMRQLARFEGYAETLAVTERELLARGLAPTPTPQFTAIVAESPSGELCGYAVVHELAFTYDLRPTLILKELFIADDRRGQGVGTAIMEAVLAHARRAGCGRLRWDVLPDNSQAKAFYRRFGGRPNTAWESWILPLEEPAR